MSKRADEGAKKGPANRCDCARNLILGRRRGIISRTIDEWHRMDGWMNDDADDDLWPRRLHCLRTSSVGLVDGRR